MFLQLNHKSLAVYKEVRLLVKEVYQITIQFPEQERFNLIQQIRRAVVSVKLNLAEGSTRKSAIERKRFLEISRGSLVEVDAAFETAVDLNYITVEDAKKTGEHVIRCFIMLSGMINKIK